MRVAMVVDKQYPRVGASTVTGQVYELAVDDFLQPMSPPNQFEMEELDPNDYFITSGDAVQKTKYLCTIIWSYAGKARKQLNGMNQPTAASKKFERLCWEQAGSARKMLNALIGIRGEDVFLETEWNEHMLIVIPKNPRVRKIIPKNKGVCKGEQS